MFYDNTRDFMTQIAPFYDYICFPCSDERILFFENFKDNNSIKSVLDTACSTGETCYRLYKGGFEVSGLDFSSGMIAQSIGRKFDIVYNNSLIWIPTIDYVRQTISSAFDVLNNNGIFIIDIPNSDLFISTYKKQYISSRQVSNNHFYKISTYKEYPNRTNKELTSLQTYIVQDIQLGVENIYSCWLKLRLHGLDELIKILKEYNFEILEIYGDYIKKDIGVAASYQIIGKK